MIADTAAQSYTIEVLLTGNQYGDGSVGSDIPGTALALGASRGSVVDKDLKPRDVHALSLIAGQEVQFKATKQGALRFQLANPGSHSFQTGGVTLAFNELRSASYSTWTRNFVPPITGTYYLAVIPDTSAQPYTIQALLTGNQYGKHALTVTVSGGGTTNPGSGTHVCAEGTKVTITALPDSGWMFERWQGDASGTVPTVTVTMDSDKRVTARFARQNSTETVPLPEPTPPHYRAPTQSPEYTPSGQPDPAPVSAPAPKSTPKPGEVSVHLHLERTRVLVGEQITATLSIANSIAKPPMTVRLILKAPPGMSVSSTEHLEAGAGQYIGNYEVDAGSLRHIGLTLHANEHGEFLVQGHLEWFFGEDPTTLESRTQNFTVTVQRDGTEPMKPPIRESATAWPLIVVAATAMTTLLLVVVRTRRV